MYTIANKKKTVLYIGVTNDLLQRLIEHYLNRGNPKSFAGKYYCYQLLYYESFSSIDEAIAREKEIKKWPRRKKDELINELNPYWKSLNNDYFDKWPPDDLFHRRDL